MDIWLRREVASTRAGALRMATRVDRGTTCGYHRTHHSFFVASFSWLLLRKKRPPSGGFFMPVRS